MQAFAAVSGAGSASLVLLLTELTGLYAISTVLLIRKQLPLKYRCAEFSDWGVSDRIPSEAACIEGDIPWDACMLPTKALHSWQMATVDAKVNRLHLFTLCAGLS